MWIGAFFLYCKTPFPSPVIEQCSDSWSTEFWGLFSQLGTDFRINSIINWADMMKKFITKINQINFRNVFSETPPDVGLMNICMHIHFFIIDEGDLRTICRFSYMKVYKLITLGTKFKTLLSLGRKITMFSKFITNYIEQGWWHSSLTLKCMHLLLKEVNKRGRHAYNLHGWTCLPSGIVMEIHCHITGIFEAAVRLRLPSCCSV